MRPRSAREVPGQSVPRNPIHEPISGPYSGWRSEDRLPAAAAIVDELNRDLGVLDQQRPAGRRW